MCTHTNVRRSLPVSPTVPCLSRQCRYLTGDVSSAKVAAVGSGEGDEVELTGRRNKRGKADDPVPLHDESRGGQSRGEAGDGEGGGERGGQGGGRDGVQAGGERGEDDGEGASQIGAQGGQTGGERSEDWDESGAVGGLGSPAPHSTQGRLQATLEQTTSLPPMSTPPLSLNSAPDGMPGEGRTER